jgi:hypothetical protein
MLAAYWLDVAALEHASVASFARFTLDLLAVDAPARLVADAQRAALDEVEHARLAYGLASAYAGRPLGPGPLDVAGVAPCADAGDLLRSLVMEGCVGETVAVIEALAAADAATDPVLTAAYRRIAADEQRHAELAWRTLAWLLDGPARGLVSYASACFDGAMGAHAKVPHRGAASPVHGVLGACALRAVRRAALSDVVAPSAAALLGAKAPLRPSTFAEV